MNERLIKVISDVNTILSSNEYFTSAQLLAELCIQLAGEVDKLNSYLNPKEVYQQ